MRGSPYHAVRESPSATIVFSELGFTETSSGAFEVQEIIKNKEKRKRIYLNIFEGRWNLWVKGIKILFYSIERI